MTVQKFKNYQKRIHFNPRIILWLCQGRLVNNRTSALKKKKIRSIKNLIGLILILNNDHNTEISTENSEQVPASE